MQISGEVDVLVEVVPEGQHLLALAQAMVPRRGLTSGRHCLLYALSLENLKVVMVVEVP